MIFYPPTWLPAIPQDLSAAGTVIGDFVLRGGLSANGETPAASGDDQIFISAATQEILSRRQALEDVEALAAGLAHELKWVPNEPAQGGKVVAILCENTIEYMTYCWAVHRIGGSCLLLHTTNSALENTKHIKDSGCKILIVSPALAEAGRATVGELDGSDIRVFKTKAVVDGSAETNGNHDGLPTLHDLIVLGKTLASLPAVARPVEGSDSSIAFLCSTSGTSGVQKLARLTHRGIIANVLQVVTHERASRERKSEVTLGILPMSHVQGMISAHGSVYCHDPLVLHPKFDMKASLASVQAFHIQKLYVIPAILANLVMNPFLFKVFDLTSIEYVYVGAGSLPPELHGALKALQPNWKVIAGYGLTESSAVVALSSPHEHVPGAAGTLLPQYQARLLREDGGEIDDFDQPGELVLSSPSIVLGYVGDDQSNATTFKDGWLHTGDVALFHRSPAGDAYLCIVDRLRDMIKVKGMQISPVAIEACLRKQGSISEVAVIGVSDNMGGERAKAFVVPSKPLSGESDAASLFAQLDEHVQTHLTEPHWIRGRYELLEALPRNASGKVSKGVLRAK